MILRGHGRPGGLKGRLYKAKIKPASQERRSPTVMILRGSGRSSVSQNKLPQLILGYIYILKYLQSNFIGYILFF